MTVATERKSFDTERPAQPAHEARSLRKCAMCLRTTMLFLVASLAFSDRVDAAGTIPSFDIDIRAILSKAGCNLGACHASQHGKGGFKLSVVGFDPGQDHEAVVRDRLGRR